jgi:biotin carboxylase
MNSQFIYVVGQPDTTSSFVEAVHQAGYQAGILLDTQLSSKKLDAYDRIIPMNFDNVADELIRLDSLSLNMTGLVCTYENYIVAKATIGEHFKVATLSVESARLSTDKSLMRQAFLAHDTTISPDFSTVDSLQQALDFASTHSYPLIIKPTNLVKSLLVLRCDNEEQLRDRFTYAASTIEQLYEKYKIYDRAPQLIIEEFIQGEQFSIAAFVDQYGVPHFCDGIVKLRNAQDIHVDDNYLYSRTLPAPVTDEAAAEMYATAEKGVRALKMTSVPAHIELMSGPQGTKIIEIGARIGGYRPRMYNYTYNVDLTAQEIRLALSQEPNLKGDFQKHTAVYELFPEQEGMFEQISGSFDIEKLTYYRVTAKQGSLVGPAKNGFKATAIIIVTNSDEVLFNEICSQVESAKVEIS